MLTVAALLAVATIPASSAPVPADGSLAARAVGVISNVDNNIENNIQGGNNSKNSVENHTKSDIHTTVKDGQPPVKPDDNTPTNPPVKTPEVKTPEVKTPETKTPETKTPILPANPDLNHGTTTGVVPDKKLPDGAQKTGDGGIKETAKPVDDGAKGTTKPIMDHTNAAGSGLATLNALAQDLRHAVVNDWAATDL